MVFFQSDDSGLAEDRLQIDPTMQNEWYYVRMMIVESELLDRKVTVRVFIAQMLDWFPEVLDEMTGDEQKKAFVWKMENCISAEKRKWMQSGVEVPFKESLKNNLGRKLLQAMGLK